MDRAQREADGPRRRILEAAKVKGTVRSEAPALPQPVTAAPTVVATPAPAPAANPAPEQRSPALATLPAALQPLALPASAAATVPAVPTVSQVELAPAAAPLMALPSTKVITLAPPRLLSKVDPELPSRLLRRGTRRIEVVVELTIAVDGSVRDVALRSPVEEDLETSLRDALVQWRYDAQPVPRPHTVQLVFGAS